MLDCRIIGTDGANLLLGLGFRFTIEVEAVCRDIFPREEQGCHAIKAKIPEGTPILSPN